MGTGCSDRTPPADDPDLPPTGTAPATAEGVPDASVQPGGWDRELVFMELGADSALLLPWHIRAFEADASLRWERSLRRGQAGSWDFLLADTLTSPRTRAPWRILASGPLQMIVEADDVLSSLILEAGAREYELNPVEFLVEWSRPEGGAVRLHRGVSRTADRMEPDLDQSLDGIVLDFSRAWSEGQAPPGGWIFLTAGLPTQFFFEETATSDEGPGTFRGWSRVAFQTRTWPALELHWEEVRAFERARRDIPRRWAVRSSGGTLEGELEAVSSHLVAGEGSGPLLPVTAYFEVTGEIRVDGELIPVRGLIRHIQR
ncbi:MAG: hypothetical protein EA351_01875 [Gemmatimonadales bacterium]|nr:MAG: hypothetical protein EA351_01875 [Gemmatimonadales bacterium]